MSVNKRTYEAAMRSGHQLAWAMKWDAAVKSYKTAVDAFPKGVAARSSLATALQRLGRIDEALAQCQALLELAPDDDTVLVRVAELLDQLGRVTELKETLLQLAERYLRNDERDKAVATWMRLAEGLADDLEAQEDLYHAVSKSGEIELAGKIGLHITKLRGEQNSRGLAVNAVPVTTPAFVDQPAELIDEECLVKARQELAQAKRLENSGSSRDALLAYAAASASLRQAGANGLADEIEQSAAALADQVVGSRLRDLALVDSAMRPEIIERLSATRDQLAAGRLFAAIDESFAAIAIAPDCLTFQERLAQAQVLQGDLQQAAERYRNIAEIYVMRRDFEAANSAMSRASATGAVESASRQQFITSLLDAGEEAIALEQVLELASELEAAGSMADAVRELERAARLAPTKAPILIRLGRACERSGNFVQAVDAYRAAIEIAETDIVRWHAAQRLSMAASLAGDWERAEQGLEIVLGALAAQTAEQSSWVQEYASCAVQHPDCLELQYCLGASLSRLGRRGAALEPLESAAQARGPVSAAAHLLLGQQALDADLRAAAEHLEEARRRIQEFGNPTARCRADLHRLAGLLHLRRGELGQAAAAFAEVKAVDPHDTQIFAQLAEVHFRLGNNACALAELVSLGDKHFDQGHHELALSAYHGATQLAPDDPVTKRKLAETYQALGRDVEAISAMDELVTLLVLRDEAEQAVQVLRSMIEICRQSDPTHALALRQRVAQIAPQSLEVRQELIAAYLSTGQSDVALSESHRLWQDMLAVERWREAATALEQVIRIDPWNAEVLARLGELYEQLEDFSKAVQSYRRALAISGDNIGVAARLARLATNNTGAD